MKDLTHIDEEGRARMVDVSEKPETLREAVASGVVLMKAETARLILDRRVPKGDVIAAARIAGIMAAKKTSELLPMCHLLELTSVVVNLTVEEQRCRVVIEACVRNVGRTGVEMEALTAVSVAALTVYDMCKAVDREMTIADIMLLEKRGGRSGEFRRRR